MENYSRAFPGMLPMSGVEFFNHENEEYVIENGSTKPFFELSYYHMEILKVHAAEPEADAELKRLHPSCEMSRIKKFVSCRFGGLDATPDIKDGKLQAGEYWPCPLRGSCPSEGILCKLPIYNGISLSGQDVEMMKKLHTNKTNEAIADEMNLPMGTFHRDKALLYSKLRVQTKQELSVIAFSLNII